MSFSSAPETDTKIYSMLDFRKKTLTNFDRIEIIEYVLQNNERNYKLITEIVGKFPKTLK